MMCFRDRSFCSASVTRCVNEACDRFFGPKQQAEADVWWEEPGAPVAFMDFEPGCDIVIKTVRMLAPALVGLKCLEPYLDMSLEEARRASALDDSPEQARRDAAEEMRERCARHVFEWFDCWDSGHCILGGKIRALPLPGDKT